MCTWWYSFLCPCHWIVQTFYGIMKMIILLGSTWDHEIENLYASKPIFSMIQTSPAMCNHKAYINCWKKLKWRFLLLWFSCICLDMVNNNKKACDNHIYIYIYIYINKWRKNDKNPGSAYKENKTVQLC